jgi:hypothetical protein
VLGVRLASCATRAATTLGVLIVMTWSCGGAESKDEPPEAAAVRGLFDKLRHAIPPAGGLPACGKPDPTWPLITWRGLNLIADHHGLTGLAAPESPPFELDDTANAFLDSFEVGAIHDPLATTSYKARCARALLAAPGFLIVRVDQANAPTMGFGGTFDPGKVEGRVLQVRGDGRALCETRFTATNSEAVSTGLVRRGEGEAWLKAELSGDLMKHVRTSILAAAGRPEQ